jgi:very-short-patch-repair endonuclease
VKVGIASMFSSKGADVAERLEVSRNELLDLGLRNSLLNYRRSKAKSVDVVDESSRELFRILVSQGKNMYFLPEDEESNGGTRNENDTKSRLTDKYLQTPYTKSNLQSRLLKIHHYAKNYIEERGFNILYLALGMLHWYEDDSSEKIRVAPLVTVPVELSRTTARDRFLLKYDGEEIHENLSLYAKLKFDFGIELPDVPEFEDLDLYDYFKEVEKRIAGHSRWSISRDEVSLGFFSFGKFLMYRDLGEDVWPDGGKPRNHGIMSALLETGFSEQILELGDDEQLDAVLPPDKLNLVVEADSSQLLTLLNVAAGSTMVVQGPPGTGKSQTITNIIARALAEGKSVLFVAEKMAALEVVKRRMDTLGLGDACLELHSHNAKRKNILAELKRTHELGKPVVGSGKRELNQYAKLIQRLNAYANSLHKPIGQTNLTPFRVFGQLLQHSQEIDKEELPLEIRVSEALPHDWNSADFDKWVSETTSMQRAVSEMGPPNEHPYAVSGLTVTLPADRRELESRLQRTADVVRQVQHLVMTLSEACGMTFSLRLDECRAFAAGLQRALLAPELEGVTSSIREWQANRDIVFDLVEKGLQYTQIESAIGRRVILEAWEVDLLETRASLRIYSSKWYRFFVSNYRKARRQIKGLLVQDERPSPQEMLSLVEQLMRGKQLKESIAESDGLGHEMFGVQWQGTCSDWVVLRKVTDWILKLFKDFGDSPIPVGIIKFMSGSRAIKSLEPDIQALDKLLDECDQVLRDLLQRLQVNDLVSSTLLRDWDLDGIATLFDTMAESLDRLGEQVRFNNARKSLVESGLVWVVDIATDWHAANRKLVSYFQYLLLNNLLKHVLSEHPELRDFIGANHEESIRQFRGLDRMHLEYNRARIAYRHWETLPRGFDQGQVGILMREFQKKSRHLPIRRLLTEAGDAIKAIKPVFMMSPMSVAAFLKPETAMFDLVVFDEASQVKPVDAFGAILRGKQLVVVGDDKQLPPTSFFDTMLDSDEEDDDLNITSAMESILGLMLARGAPEKMLRWHYRSRHESLIMTSNTEFYNNRLFVFPSPSNGNGTNYLGLKFKHLPDAFYDRGRTRTNKQEALAVAEAVIQHAKEHGEETLGVATFSMAQMHAVQDEVERLRLENPDIEAFFTENQREPFFIKNLESVQGDERDVIFISIGYGRSGPESSVAMNFGALNNNGGERRLNVLISRARMRCVVFSNLTHNDIDLSKTNARGVVALKRFLKYAQTGDYDMPVPSGGGPDSLFEELVGQALINAGYEIHRQVGSAGFFIDIAVVDPEKPGRYILGIECDGASYHSSRTARDRDRIRQEVLEGLGWTIYRIWSTDWFQNPEAELRKCCAAIEKAKSLCPSITPGTKPLPVRDYRRVERVQNRRVGKRSLSARKYKPAECESFAFTYNPEYTPYKKMSEAVRHIVSEEGPIHQDLLLARLQKCGGIARLGHKAKAMLCKGIGRAVRDQVVVMDGDFYLLPDGKTPIARDWSSVEQKYKKPEYIHRSELAAVVVKVAEESMGIDRAQLPKAVGRLTGFAATAAFKETIEDAVRRLIAERKLELVGDMIKLID